MTIEQKHFLKKYFSFSEKGILLQELNKLREKSSGDEMYFLDGIIEELSTDTGYKEFITSCLTDSTLEE